MKFNVHWPGENNVAVPATAKQPWVKPRAEGLFEMTLGSGRFQRLQVSFYQAKTGIDVNGQAWYNTPFGGWGRFVVKVAQLVRALDCGSRGRGFESPLSPFFVKNKQIRKG